MLNAKRSSDEKSLKGNEKEVKDNEKAFNHTETMWYMCSDV